MATLKDILTDGDKFAASCGITIKEICEGYATAEVKITKRHLNAAGVCQGGVYFTLADLAFAAVMNSHKQITLGIQNSITFLKSAKEGDTLTAEAKEIVDHHKLPFCEIRIFNQDMELVCMVTGSAYRKRDTFQYEKLME